MFGNGNGKEWEKPYGNPMGMGIGYKNWEWEWEGMGIDCTGMGGSGNVKSHSRSSLTRIQDVSSASATRRPRSSRTTRRHTLRENVMFIETVNTTRHQNGVNSHETSRLRCFGAIRRPAEPVIVTDWGKLSH